MSRKPFYACAAALAVLGVCTPVAAQGEVAPASTEEVQALRREIQELRDQVQALRDQVAGLSGTARALPVAPPSTPAPPEAAAPPAPVTTAPARSQNLMNPAISAVFQAIGNTSLKLETEENGFDLSEAEIAFQSVVDPYAKVDLFLSFPAGQSPEVEEGFVSTLALPHSLQLKGGRFKN
ncbi:MAG TPA: hypothetical protein VKL61_10380, partial [Candidatus Polarisedimenticolia bacterium]|nr:hypothetical protein [Candidatus Polarisedimenticolia bacterium]